MELAKLKYKDVQTQANAEGRIKDKDGTTVYRKYGVICWAGCSFDKFFQPENCVEMKITMSGFNYSLENLNDWIVFCNLAGYPCYYEDGAIIFPAEKYINRLHWFSGITMIRTIVFDTYNQYYYKIPKLALDMYLDTDKFYTPFVCYQIAAYVILADYFDEGHNTHGRTPLFLLSKEEMLDRCKTYHRINDLYYSNGPTTFTKNKIRGLFEEKKYHEIVSLLTKEID